MTGDRNATGRNETGLLLILAVDTENNVGCVGPLILNDMGGTNHGNE